MGVRVDESRHQHAAATIDLMSILKTLAQGRNGVDRGDLRTDDRDADVGSNTGVVHFGAAPRARRTGARDHLRRVHEQGRLARASRGHAITSRIRERRIGAWASPRHA
jgi:hypothetical protein